MKTSQAGLTLLELIIVAGIGLLVSVFLIRILVNNTGLFYKENAIINEGVSLNDTMHQINNYVREAAKVASGYPEASPTYLSGTETLVLKLPAYNASGVISNVYDYVVITKDSANLVILRLYVFPNAQSSRQSENRVLTTLLKSLEFKYFDKSGNTVTPTSAVLVETNLTILAKTGTISSERSAKMRMSLRNSV